MNDKADTKVSQGQFKQDIVRCCAQRRNQHKTENIKMFPTAAVNMSPILKITFNNIVYSYFPMSIITGTFMKHSLRDAFNV